MPKAKKSSKKTASKKAEPAPVEAAPAAPVVKNQVVAAAEQQPQTPTLADSFQELLGQLSALPLSAH